MILGIGIGIPFLATIGGGEESVLPPFVMQNYEQIESGRVIATAGNRMTWQSGHGFNSLPYAVDGARFVIPNTISHVGGPDGELTGVENMGPATVRAAIVVEPGDDPIQLTFDGALTKTIAEGENAITDALDVQLPAAFWALRMEYVTSIASQSIPAGPGFQGSPRDGGVLGTNALMGATFTDDGSSTRIGKEMAILGTPVAASTKYVSHRVVEVGDSITAGRTYWAATMNAVDVAYYWAAQAGHSVRDWASRPTEYAKGRAVILFGGAPTMICNWGVNDIRSGRTAAQLITDITALAAAHAAAGGVRFILGTITPLTSSSDAWATTGNQTALYGTNVSTYNAWVRAVPTLGTLEVLVIECGAAVTDTNPDKWIAGMTDDGVHPNATGFAAMGAAITTAATAAILADFGPSLNFSQAANSQYLETVI